MTIDLILIKKIYRSAAILWGVAMIWCLALRLPWIALSITLGALLAIGLLASFVWIVPRLFVPGAVKPSKRLIIFGAIKFLVIAVIIFWAVRWHSLNLIALCGGIVLVHLAIVAKVLGIRMAERLKQK